jgi:hypothetical protein
MAPLYVLRECNTAGGLVKRGKSSMANRGYYRRLGQAITPPPSDGLVGIHHKLVNHWCALEDWANKKEEKNTWPVLTLRAPRTAGHTTRRGEFFFWLFFLALILFSNRYLS